MKKWKNEKIKKTKMTRWRPIWRNGNYWWGKQVERERSRIREIDWMCRYIEDKEMDR